MTESTQHIHMQGYARLLGLELELVSGSYREILAKKKKKKMLTVRIFQEWSALP